MTLNVLLVGKSWKPFENSIQGSENKPVSQYENRQRKQQEKDEEWKQKLIAMIILM